MKKMWILYKKELEIYFLSPLAYSFLGIFLFLAGLFFYLGLGISPEPNIRIMSNNLSLSLLFLLPLLTMRQFAEEVRVGTFELMMTSPVPLFSLILSKWLASVTLCLLLCLGTGIFPLILDYFGSPDWGAILGSYVGLLLCSMAFVSAGLFSSAVIDEPVAAGLGGVVLLLPFWLAGVGARFMEKGLLQEIVQELSFLAHLETFSEGLIDSVDVFWFLSFTTAFLGLTWRALESRRWR